MHLKGILSVIGILSIFMSYGQAQNSHLRWVVLPDSLIQVNSFGEGLAKVQTSTGRIGYIDSSGNYIIRLNKSFVDAGNFQDGYAWVCRKAADSKQYGFIDKKGNIRISCQYDKVENFSNGLTLVHKGAIGWQLIDSTGSVLLGDTSLLIKVPVYQGDKLVEWQEIEPPVSQGGRMLTFKAGKYGYLNSQGQPVIACRFLKATGYANGVALVAVDSVKDQFAKMDTTRDLLDDLYDNLEPGPPEYIWALIDSNGQQIRTFDPGWTLDVTRGFSQGLLPFKNEQGFWGFIDTHGQVTIPAKFRQEPSPFSDGVCFLSVRGQSADNKDGYMLVIDTAGEKIAKIPFCNKNGCIYDSRQAYHEGLMAVKIGQNWGYMDKTGKMVVPPEYETALDFCEGRAVVITQDGRLKVLINPLHYIRHCIDLNVVWEIISPMLIASGYTLSGH